MRFLIFGKSKLTRNLRFSDDIPFPSLQFLSNQTKDERGRKRETWRERKVLLLTASGKGGVKKRGKDERKEDERKEKFHFFCSVDDDWFWSSSHLIWCVCLFLYSGRFFCLYIYELWLEFWEKMRVETRRVSQRSEEDAHCIWYHVRTTPP